MEVKLTSEIPFPRIRFYHVFKILVLLLCVGLFIAQVYTFFELYLKNATVTGITYEKSLTKIFPSVTVCPEGLLKRPGFPISPQEFDELSFKLVTTIFSTFLQLIFHKNDF